MRSLKVLFAFREGLRHPERVDIRRRTFAAETTSRLGFLIQQHGFAGPEITQDGDYPLVIHVTYHRSDLDVRVTLILSHGGEEYVTTDLVHKSAARRTELSSGTAHTGFQMRRALDRHAQALRELFNTQQPDSNRLAPGFRPEQPPGRGDVRPGGLGTKQGTCDQALSRPPRQN